MKENDILFNIIDRIKNQYIIPALKEEKDEFNEGVLLGFSGVMGVIKNEIISYYGEDKLKEYGIDFNCDTFFDISK